MNIIKYKYFLWLSRLCNIPARKPNKHVYNISPNKSFSRGICIRKPVDYMQTKVWYIYFFCKLALINKFFIGFIKSSQCH